MAKEDIIKEIIASEKEYTDDLILWAHKFCHGLELSPNILGPEKNKLISDIFSNIEKILILHSKLIYYIENGKDDEKWDFLDCFIDFLQNIACYEQYIKEFTISEYVFRREMATNNEFYLYVEVFLENIKLTHLDYSHFIKRPYQKILRYDLMFKRLLSKENDPVQKEKILNFLEGMEKFTNKLLQIYEESKNFARIYEIYHWISLDTTNNIFLDLTSSKRKLYDEKYVKIIIENVHDQLKNAKIFVFDNLMLLCSFEYFGELETYKIIKVLTYPSCILQKVDSKFERKIKYFDEEVKIIFRSGYLAENWTELFLEVRNEYIKHINKYVERKIRLRTEENIKITSLASVINCECFFDSAISDRFKSPVDDIYEHKIDLEKPTCFKKLFSCFQETDINFFIPFNGLSYISPKVIIYSTNELVYKQEYGFERVFVNEPFSKAVYFYKLAFILYLSKGTLYVGILRGSYMIESLIFYKNVTNFFVYNSRQHKFVAVVVKITEYEYTVRIFLMKRVDNKIALIFINELLVGSYVYHISSVDDLIILVSDTILIINPYNLIACEFINVRNLKLPFYFKCTINIAPQFIQQIETKVIIVCYSSFAVFMNRNGFLLDELGTVSWQFDAVDFAFVDDMLYVAGENCVAMLKKNTMLFFKEYKGYRTCNINNEIYFYNETQIFKLKIKKNAPLEFQPGEKKHGNQIVKE